MAETNIIALLDAYESARANTDRMQVLRTGAPAAETAFQTAMAAEENAIDDAIRELRQLEPELNYQTARALVAIPADRANLRAIYE